MEVHINQVKSMEKGLEISSEFVLTEDECRIALATAKLHKIKRLEWLGRRYHKDVSAEEAELTKDEKEAAIIQTNKLKIKKLELEAIRNENRARRMKEQEDLIALWGYEYFYKQLKDRAWQQGEELIYNEQTAPIVRAICWRLSNSRRYETDFGFSFRKGLIIRGEPGLGKSWVIKLLADNPINPVQVITMNEVAESVRKTGEFKGVKFASHSIIYIDDVGTEVANIKNYGNEVNWFKDFLEGIYATDKRQLRRIILSTNCSAQEFEERYGFRVRDRIAEMFDILELEGTSLRRK